MTEKLGFSGRVARLFLDSELTPLLGITALLLGVFAVLVTPREEEPQINVTFANVIVPFPGASAAQVESLVSSPMEKVLGEIAGVKHIYSVSRPGWPCSPCSSRWARSAPRRSSGCTTPSTRTRTGGRPASACCSRSSSPRASTTCRS